jgi:peptide/nickel transport system substrate-binding protein
VKRNLFALLSLLVITSVMLTACGGAATEAPAPIEDPATEAPAPTEAPATEAPETEAPADFDGMSVAAPDCDYGGKISSIEAVDQLTVVFNLCKPDPAFLAKVAFTPFGIQPSEYIEATGGTGDILERPIGTGPYMIENWARGDSITYRRFDNYWGEPAIAETAVLRWATEGAARLLELQSGTVDLITNVSPDDFEVVNSDPNLVLNVDPNPNVFYLGMTNTHAPFDNILVRQAVAMGIDRQRIVDNFYPEGSEVPGYFTPCSIPNGCEGDAWYDFDPEAARDLLAEAGFPDGFDTNIYYRDVFRVYLPEPGLVAVELQTQLRDNLGINAQVVQMESGEFIAESGAGNLAGFHLLGWGADYPHVTNFLDFHFGQANTQFGTSYPEIYEHLQEASQIGDVDEAAPIYEAANNAIREQVPMVPIAHGVSADAALASLGGLHARPFGAYVFSLLDPGDDTLVVMQNAEPISLFCADETDGESLTACQQVVETLYDYELDSGDTVPTLATSCEPNEDSTVWTCALREGVTFHDGSDFDANDVVASWAAGIDAANPNHAGNTGTFFYYEYLWDSFINPQ